MVYEIELASVYPGWWRYNLYLSLVGYDATRKRVDFSSFTDLVYDVMGDHPAMPPEGWKPDRGARLATAPCAYAEAYINVVTNTLPSSVRVSDSPEFEAVLIARADGRELLRKTLYVNCWGGFSLAAMVLDARSASQAE